MKTPQMLCALAVVLSGCLSAQDTGAARKPDGSGATTKPCTDEDHPILSRVEKTKTGYTLIQEVYVRAPIDKVWAAYVTADGWTAWASPVAAVDLKPGGTIRTHYDRHAKIGDDGTNTLRVVNFVDQRLLTLQADVSENWPDLMKKDARHLMNVIVFDDLGNGATRIHSYGVGYRKDEGYERLLEFFDEANQELFAKLRLYLEKGERTDWAKQQR